MIAPAVDAERLRIAASRDAARDRSPAGDAGGAPTMVARTTTVRSYPTTAGAFYAVAPATVLGAEIEGQAGAVTPGPGIVLALNLGSQIPPVGTNVVCTFVSSRWVFRYG